MRTNLLLSLCASLPLACGAIPAAHAACATGNPNDAVSETTPDSDFWTDSANGIVIHMKTGLMWKQCAEGWTGPGCDVPEPGQPSTFDWGEALNSANRANALGFGGDRDWRLPNKKELESIAELCGYQPAINTHAFPGTPPTNFFWTSTSYVRDPSQAWMVTSDNGASGFDSKLARHYVRLVRGGDPQSTFDSLRAQRRMTGHLWRLGIMRSD